MMDDREQVIALQKELIAQLTLLVKTQRRNSMELIDALDLTKEYLPAETHAPIENLTMIARELSKRIDSL